jgi:hypothetical protein
LFRAKQSPSAQLSRVLLCPPFALRAAFIIGFYKRENDSHLFVLLAHGAARPAWARGKGLLRKPSL